MPKRPSAGGRDSLSGREPARSSPTIAGGVGGSAGQRKVVILSGEAYERLCEASEIASPVTTTGDGAAGEAKAAEVATGKDSGAGEEGEEEKKKKREPTPPPAAVSSPTAMAAAVTTSEAPASTAAEVEEEEELEGIPKRWQAGAQRVLEQLQRLVPEIGWGDGGDQQISLGGNPLRLTKTQLLRALSVPFTRTLLPPELRRLLAERGVRGRNHLALDTAHQEPPEWRPYFRF
jgi:mRNA-degrading endonuclease toxin of MazEF toxin-antitoxin module